MKFNLFVIGLLFVFLGLSLGLGSCKHDPVYLDMDNMPVDTTENPIDTTENPVDTTMGEPCDPDLVYFNQEVLPILQSNCAFSGCHNAASAQDGVILDSYENVMATADVDPFDLDGSKIYRVLTDDDEDDRMPPPPTPRLESAQIQLISKWILQGAQDLECDPNAGGCDTDNVSYSQLVEPVLTTYCKGCHSGSAPSGGISLDSYSGVKIVADNGRLYGAIAWQNGFVAMPQGGNQLPQCTIDQIKSWIDAGAPNN